METVSLQKCKLRLRIIDFCDPAFPFNLVHNGNFISLGCLFFFKKMDFDSCDIVR